MKEKLIRANKEAIGVMELRKLAELSSFNKMLTEDEFVQIVKVYIKAVERVEKEAIKQGVQI